MCVLCSVLQQSTEQCLKHMWFAGCWLAFFSSSSAHKHQCPTRRCVKQSRGTTVVCCSSVTYTVMSQAANHVVFAEYR